MGEPSQMSQMSGVSEMSVASTTGGGAGGAGGGGKKTLIPVLACCLLLLGIAGIAHILSAGSGGSQANEGSGGGGGDDDGDGGDGGGSGGGGGGGGGGPSYPSNPPPTTVTTTTTTTPPPLKELICTVGDTAALSRVYPEDNLCHYLYYTHVFIGGGNLLAAEMSTSFNMFKTITKSYKGTKGGLSFDMRFTNVDIVRENKQAITALESGNIMNYGFLSMVAPIDILQQWVNKAKDIFAEFKNIQSGDASRKTVIAIGTFKYTSSWSKYKDVYNQVISKGYNADTVIVITSTNMQEEFDECKGVPPAVITATNDDYTSFQRHKELVKQTYNFTNPHTVVGVSLELGGLAYNHAKSIDLDSISLYSHCINPSPVPVDVACDLGSGQSKELDESTNIGILKLVNTNYVLWESLKTAKAKVDLIKSLPPFYRFSWLVYDVHLIDQQELCKMDKYQLIKDLKSNFEIP